MVQDVQGHCLNPPLKGRQGLSSAQQILFKGDFQLSSVFLFLLFLLCLLFPIVHKFLYTTMFSSPDKLPALFGTFSSLINVFLKVHDTQIVNRYCYLTSLLHIDEMKKICNKEIYRMKKRHSIFNKIYCSLNFLSGHCISIPCLIKMEWKMSMATNTGVKTEDLKKEVLNGFEYATQRRNCSKLVPVTCFYSFWK